MVTQWSFLSVRQSQLPVCGIPFVLRWWTGYGLKPESPRIHWTGGCLFWTINFGGLIVFFSQLHFTNHVQCPWAKKPCQMFDTVLLFPNVLRHFLRVRIWTWISFSEIRDKSDPPHWFGPSAGVEHPQKTHFFFGRTTTSLSTLPWKPVIPTLSTCGAWIFTEASSDFSRIPRRIGHGFQAVARELPSGKLT